MRYTALTTTLLVVTSCHIFGGSPGVPVCSQHLTIEGDYPHERIRESADDACRIMVDETNLTGTDLDDLPAVTVRVYGVGESTEHCQHARSGTCTARTEGGYHVDVRQQHDGRPSLTDDRVTHEVMHVLAYELGVPGAEHHRWMLKRNLCSELCTYSNSLD